MTTTARTTARHHIGRIAATRDPDLIEAVIYSGYRCCQLCELATADLGWCIDNRDGEEIQVCARCYDTADVSWTEDHDL